MDRIKLYSGSISEDTETKTIKQYYGATTNISIKKSKTELLNNKLLEFLTECGVDVEYDGNFLWINNIPMTFYFSGAYAYFFSYSPFYTTYLYGTSAFTTVFNGMNYKFNVRLLGEPKASFALLISTNYASPTFSNAFAVAFYKAKNIISNKDARVYGKYGESTPKLASFDLNDGTPVDIGRATPTNIQYTLSTYASDFTNNINKYPLVEWIPDIFKISGCYYNLQNDPLPKGMGSGSDAQTFIKIGEDVYFRTIYGPLIKCTT